MAKWVQIQEMMKAQNTPYIRVFNTNGDRLFVFENCDQVEATISEMEGLLPYISSYGKVIVEAATPSSKSRKYQGSYKWFLEFERPVGATPVQGPAPLPWHTIPKEYMHQDVVAAQLKILEARMDHEREMRQLNDKLREKEKEDPVRIMKEAAPMLLYAMGKPIEEINKVTSFLNTPAGQSGMAGPPSHTLIFKDIEKMSTEEKHKKLQTSLDELARHCSLEHMIMLTDGLSKKLDPAKGGNPQFITTVLSFI